MGNRGESRIKLIAGPSISQPCQEMVLFVNVELTGPQELRELVLHLGGQVPDDDKLVFRQYPNGLILQQRLSEFINSHREDQIDPSQEDILTIQYDASSPEPEIIREITEPDWIRSVATDGHHNIVSGSFDRAIRWYRVTADNNIELKAIWKGVHRDAITALRWIQTDCFVSGDASGDIYLWSTTVPGGPPLGCLTTGKKTAIQDFLIDGGKLLVVNSEGYLTIFDCHGLFNNLSSSNNIKLPLSEEQLSKGPIAGLALGLGCRWAGTWNGELIRLGNSTRKWTTRPISAVSSLGEQGMVLGHSNGMISIWHRPNNNNPNGNDNGEAGDEMITEKIKTSQQAHQGWVSAVASSPDGLMLISAGYDGRVLWWDGQDLRNPLKALINTTGRKILALDWVEDLLVVGGESKQLTILRFGRQRLDGNEINQLETNRR